MIILRSSLLSSMPLSRAGDTKATGRMVSKPIWMKAKSDMMTNTRLKSFVLNAKLGDGCWEGRSDSSAMFGCECVLMKVSMDSFDKKKEQEIPAPFGAPLAHVAIPPL